MISFKWLLPTHDDQKQILIYFDRRCSGIQAIRYIAVHVLWVEMRLLLWLIRDSEREFRASPCASWGSNNRSVLPFLSSGARGLHACLPFKKSSAKRDMERVAPLQGKRPSFRISCLCAGGFSAATPFDCTCAMAKLLRQRLDLLRDKLQLICLR